MNETLMIAVALGVPFGVALESAGLGNARKIAGVFYLSDFTVVKLMFSAILTAMLGMFWLAAFGVIDLADVYVPETWIWPQLAGGILFGAGLVASGLCPGTACVSAASGRLDGLIVLAGIIAGMGVAGLLFPTIEPWLNSGGLGVQTLPQIIGLRHGVVVLVITVMALLMFRMTSIWERKP